MVDLLFSLVLLAAPPSPDSAPPAPTAAPAPMPKATPTPASKPAVLEGIVKGPDGKPVEGALVVARPSTYRWSDTSHHTRSGADGRFRLTPGTPPFNVRVDAKGLVGATLEKVNPKMPLAVSLTRGGTIEGVVKDAASGQPVGGARVTAAQWGALSIGTAWMTESGHASASSDAKGRFRLDGIGRGRHTVSAVARGYSGVSRPATAAAAAPIELLLFPGGSISGVVLDAEGRPVTDAVVRAHPEARGGPIAAALAAQRTDAAGRFEVLGVPPGSWTILAVHPEFATGTASGLTVERGADTPAEVTLDTGARVVGRLVDPEGAPVAGRVVLHETDGLPGAYVLGELARAEAGADGRFILPRFQNGAHVLAVSSPGLLSTTAEAEVRRGDREVDLGDVVLERGAQARGRVKDRTGAPLANARVTVRPQIGAMGRFWPMEAETAEDGTFVVALPSASTHVLAASAPGHASEMKAVDPEGPPVEFVLAPAGRITGQVVDERGQAVETFMVNAEPAAGTERRSSGRGKTFTAPDGSFSLDDVPEGDFVVNVRAPERGRKVVSGVRISSGGTTALGKLVLSGGGTLRGVVLDSAGAPVGGATVSVGGVSPWDGHGSESTLSDGGGSFEFRGLEAGTMRVTADHPSFAAGAETVEVDPARGPTDVRVVLSQGGRVTGTVKDRHGTPARGGMVIVAGLETGPRGPSESQAWVQPDGTYAVEHVAPGRARVTLARMAGAGDAGSVSRDAEVAAGETTMVDFLSREVQVTGRLTRGGQPLSGVRLMAGLDGPGGTTVNARSAGSGSAYGASGDDGSYTIRFDSPGLATIRFESPAGQQALPVRRAEIPDVEAHTLDFEFPLSAITGTVVDRDTGQPIGRASVAANATDQALLPAGARAQSGAEGRFTLALDPGSYVVTAGAEGYATDRVQATLTDTLDLTFALARGESIAGRVLDRHGRPAQHVLITASSTGEGSTWLGSDTTRIDGTFALTGLAQGTYALMASETSLGYGLAGGVPAGRKDLTLALRPWVRARVRVLSPDGQPVPAARAAYRTVNGTRVGFSLGGGITGPDGMAELLLPAGAIGIAAMKENRVGHATVSVADGETPSIEITLEEPQPTEDR